ncbi:MAG: exodeoxyribonuclease V subunit gamma, partial [Candidatus Hydrogenedentes bacterium]|nr:exodeoxyribonuclease V subunit gamma [Candidatus Hydrogenedentota bacterium]
MGSAEIILGPINSGKSRRAMDEYVACIAESRCDSAILILPTRKKATQTRKTVLLNYEVSALVSSQIMTFGDVVQLVLESARHPGAPISDVGRYIVLERILKGMDETDELIFFKNVAEFPGLVDVVGQFISELKLCEVEPEQFSAALKKRGASSKDNEIASIYSKYQQELHERNLYDTEGGYWIATGILRRRGCTELRKVELAIIDGFLTFTSAQLTLVEEMAKLVPRIVFTLDYDGATDRQNLFAAPERTLRILKERFQQIKVVAMEAPPSDLPIATLERELFRKTGSRDRARMSASDKIRIIEAPTELREVEEIAREAKRLIFECGYEPDDIAVVFRALGGYASLVRDTFRSYGLPCHVAGVGQVSRSPVVKAILGAVVIAETDWERESVIRLVKSNYVKLGGDWSELLPERVERWARRVAILRAKAQWLERLDRKKQILESRRNLPDSVDAVSENEQQLLEQRTREQVAEIGEVIAFVRELANVLDILPPEGTTSDYARAVCEIVRRLGIRDAVLSADSPEILRKDLSAYSRFLELLGELEQTDTRRDGEQQRYTLS